MTTHRAWYQKGTCQVWDVACSATIGYLRPSFVEYLASRYVKAVDGVSVFVHAGKERRSERLPLDRVAASSRRKVSHHRSLPNSGALEEVT